MLCKEVMRKQVQHVLPDAPVEQAARLMCDHKVGFLPVIGLDGRVVGVITDRDIALRLHATGRCAGDVTVSAIMTPHVIACHPLDALESAITLLARHQKCRLVVIEESGRLAGVISIADLAQSADPLTLARLMRTVFNREYRFERPRSTPPPII